MQTVYFISADGEPDYFKGFFPTAREESGHTLASALEDYQAWRATLPVEVAQLDRFFRISLLENPDWDSWTATLPHHRYAILAAAAAIGAWPEAQILYAKLKNQVPPASSAIKQWQSIADVYAIPLTF